MLKMDSSKFLHCVFSLWVLIIDKRTNRSSTLAQPLFRKFNAAKGR
jgi:hypothetical protein